VVPLQEIFHRVDALGVAAPLAVDAGTRPGYAGAARSFAAARAPSVEDRTQVGAARGKLLVRLLCCGAAKRSAGERKQQQQRAGEPHHQSVPSWSIAADTIRTGRCEVVLQLPVDDR
jgi:hypothetical protein